MNANSRIKMSTARTPPCKIQRHHDLRWPAGLIPRDGNEACRALSRAIRSDTLKLKKTWTTFRNESKGLLNGRTSLCYAPAVLEILERIIALPRNARKKPGFWTVRKGIRDLLFFGRSLVIIAPVYGHAHSREDIKGEKMHCVVSLDPRNYILSFCQIYWSYGISALANRLAREERMALSRL